MTASPIRVTHLIGDLHEGGYETLIADMARRFHGSPVILSAISLSGRAGRIGGEIAPLLAHYETIRPARGISMVFPASVARAIRRTKADIIHLHSGCWYKGSLAARQARVAGIIYTEHGREHDDPPFAQWLDRRAARRTDVVVAVSGRLEAYLERVLNVPRQRLRTIQNGVDTSIFVPGEKSPDLRRMLGFPADALVLGSIGRLDAVKAYERIIDAVATLRESGRARRPVAGVIWGEGPERSTLEARVAARGLQDVFRLPGWTHDATICHRFLDVFSLTSHSEGASVSLMESMACGVAPVAMNVGANAEVVGPELSAQVVPAGDEAAFVDAVAQTFGDDVRRSTAGAAGRRRVLQAYSLDTMAAQYEQLYRELLARRQGGGRR